MDKPKAYIWKGELFWASEYELIMEEGDDAEPLYAAPVHASDMSQEPVDKTAKDRHEDIYDVWVEQELKEKNA